ncbi:MAG: hypothetical protein M3198_10570 [Actinomycetota bacterium]|nr:hypothetical protein [Actinomycetota bacterium]
MVGLPYLLFGLVYMARYPREADRLRQARIELPPVVRRRDGLRFWHHDYVEEP